MVFKSTSSISGFNEKIGFEKYAQSPEISAKRVKGGEAISISKHFVNAHLGLD